MEVLLGIGSEELGEVGPFEMCVAELGEAVDYLLGLSEGRQFYQTKSLVYPSERQFYQTKNTDYPSKKQLYQTKKTLYPSKPSSYPPPNTTKIPRTPKSQKEAVPWVASFCPSKDHSTYFGE
ncbi:hypothetical protein [Lentibacillus sp. JNUCC-1]|uniref:hypothetical protein n=1 Tax=Lentibacillus sp. JNUCC-1 TaxID=2654513 RepID=UPI0012E7AA6D|nr:hypothetical protein [Lentibacillus sp. JNUCC-1]